MKLNHGALQVEYDKQETETLTVTVPPNSTATVIFGGKTKNIGSGSYRFEA